MADIKLDSSPFMFGAYVSNISSSISWGGQGGSCQMTLVEDPSNGININLPPVGTAAYFKYRGFYYGGIFQRWTYKEAIGGKTYDIVLESPGTKILEGVNVILSSFEGTGFNDVSGYYKFDPWKNPNFTNQLNNIYNPFGHRENYTFGGRWGAANINSAGFPALELLNLIELISRGESEFGGPIVFGDSQYEIDLEEIKIVPEYFRIGGQSATLGSIITECADLMQFDFFPTIEPKSGIPESDGGGVISDPVIKIKSIPKQQQPEPGRVARFVREAKSAGNLISSDIGEELSDEVTQKLVIGGPASRYFVANINNCIPVWGKTAQNQYITSLNFAPTPLAYQSTSPVPVLVDEFDPSSIYMATVAELRFAMGGQEAWQTFKVFESVAKGTEEQDPWSVGVELDTETLQALAIGNRGPLSLASTSIANAGKKYNETVKEYVSKIYNAVNKVATQFYGQMFLIPLPYEPGGLLNNLKFIREEVDEVPSWETSDSAWTTYKPISDVAFYDSSGRLKSVSVYPMSNRYDYSAMGGDYAIWNALSFGFGYGLCTSKSGPDNGKIIFIFDRPYVVFNAGVQILNFDQYTTPDFGLTFLAQYFLNLNIPPENYIGPGKSNTQVPVPPNAVPPAYIGVPQQSQRYSWGPWYGFGTKNGKSEVVFDTSLVPETFGSVEGMNQTGVAYAVSSNAQISASESGYIEIAEFPQYNIADRFAGSGPYITNMDISIGIGGLTTKYQFNTWTPKFGKLAKYNSDRISRIYKGTLGALQRLREDRPKRPFNPIKFEKTDTEELAARFSQNMNDVSFSLGMMYRNPHAEVSGINLSNAAALAIQKWSSMAGCSEDQKWTPFSTKKNKDGNVSPGIMAPSVSGEGGDFLNGDSLFPTANELDPYFPTSIFGDDGSQFIANCDYMAVINETGGSTTDLQLRKIQDRQSIDTIRSMALRGPLVLSGWGYDIANNPVPNNGNIGEFDSDLASQRVKWKTGPVKLMWDDERQIWTGGLDIISGILNSNITAPTSPTSPTTFTIKPFKKTGDGKGSGALTLQDETITCYNRDPSLDQDAGSDVFVIAIRINYEWTPLWVGCP